MSERELFGTDGIRGRANVYPMTPEVMIELGRALAAAFRLSPGEERIPRVIIGRMQADDVGQVSERWRLALQCLRQPPS